MEKIKLEDVLFICDNFNTDSKNNLNQLQDLKNRLEIKSYLPMELKILSLYKMIGDSNRPIGAHSSIFTTALEMAFLFDGLLMYTNIDVDILDNLKTYESYDSFCMAGLDDYILQFCEKDYNRLIKMMERTISYENIIEFIETMQGFDTDSVQALTQDFKEFKNNLDPRVLHDMADLARYNDPMLYKIKENVIDDALSQIERMDKVEKIKNIDLGKN